MMRRSLITPSYAQGFARSQGEAQHPGLWRGLVGAWIPMLGPSGTVLYDVSGRNNHGPFTSGLSEADWISTGIGPAISFDGTDDYIVLPRYQELNLGLSNASLCVWVRYTTTVSSYGGVIANGTLSGNVKGHGFYTVKSGGGFVYQVRELNTTALAVNSLSALNDGRWHFCVGVLDRNSATGGKLYVDGVLNGTADGSSFSGVDLDDTTKFTIGARNSTSSYDYDFAGDIAYAAQYNRALSHAEVLQLYADPLAAFRLRDRRAFVFIAAVTDRISLLEPRRLHGLLRR